ncbi:histidine kinase [Mucilaginibacter sp. Bleaf8]|uniref:sensor histidine kinase n=1 Tax=Mucilaginibacter sp. Bleaf8 TaxID=2834430 RepID=UPI001BCC71F5|nr:histidine kinase [Mucilaginibacter sp. Bleaf8]MBS7564814.1 histidine kinase [Mucilaginibacter sp. Bleaf8]
MFRKYQLKWCFIMIGILAFGSLVLRPGTFSLLNAGQYIVHAASITTTLLCCWFIHTYLKQSPLPNLSGFANAMFSIACGTVAVMVLACITALLIPHQYMFPENRFRFNYTDLPRRIITSFFASSICYVVYNNIDTSERLQHAQLENEQIKQAHLRAQLLSLQQQISPHFLFNSLSTLKTIATDSDTKNFVVQLSHVYRYLLSFNERQVSKLSEELAFIRSYLYILHQRFETALNVSIEVPEQYLNYLIPPLSIQLLIENAIKHNALSSEQPLDISICVNNKEMLVVSNTSRPKKVPAESTGLGLQNINDRFRLLFNEGIDINRTPESFTVTLPLKPYERYYH